MKLSEYAKINEITYKAAWDRFRNNKIKNAYLDEYGRIRIKEEIIKPKNIQAVLYSRVSSRENKDNLLNQSKRIEEYAIAKGYQIKYKIEEIGSGLNDKRKKLEDILKKSDWDILIVEHKDRLTRFGFNYLETLLSQNNKKIEVINLAENTTADLMQDLVSIIYSFSARLYGKRRNNRKTEKIIQELKQLDIKDDTSI